MRRGGVVAILLVGLLAALVILARRCEPSHPPREMATAKAARAAIPGAIKPTPDGGVKVRAVGALRLEGQVIDNREAPVEGATIHLSGGDDLGEDAISGADGAYVFEHLPTGHYWVSALKGDQFSSSVELDLSPTTEPLVLQLVAGHAVTIHVRDARTHDVLAGADVVAWAGNGEESSRTRRCTTNEDGRCTLHGLGFGWRLDSWTSSTGYERRRVMKILEIDPSAEDILEVELRRGAAVSGIVVDKNKVPTPQRPVSIYGHDSEETVDSGPDGRWRFDAVAAGPHQLMYDEGDRLAKRIINADGVHPLEGIELVVDAPDVLEALTGVVVDDSNQPIAGVNLYARMYKPLKMDQTTTDATGHFTVKLPPVRAFQVSAWKDELVSETDVSEVERRAPLRIVVHRSLIEGDVVDHRGRPVANAQIVRSRSEIARSDSRGHFVVRGVGSEGAELAAYATDRRVGGQFVGTPTKPGDKHVKLVVDDVSSVIGRVELDGKPLDSYTMNLSDGSQMEFAGFKEEIVHAADGHFALRGIPGGNLQINIQGLGFPRKELPLIHVTAGRDIDLGTIAIDRGQQIRGRALDPNGAPVPGARVTVHHQGPYPYMSAADLSGQGTATTKSDAAGNFTISGFEMTEGTRIIATHETIGSSGERVIDARTTSIDLVLRSTGAIDGTVDSYEYFATLSRVDDRAYSALCNVDALQRFSCENLEPGTYVVFLDGEPSFPRRVTVRAGGRAHVDLVKSKISVAAVLELTTPCTKVTLETADEFHDLIQAHACDSLEFRSLAPGSYRVCLDGTRCTPITLAADPEEQHFRLP